MGIPSVRMAVGVKLKSRQLSLGHATATWLVLKP